MFLRFALRRPFSRKIRASTEAVLSDSGRSAFGKRFGCIAGKDALAAALAALGAAYGSDRAAVEHHMRTLSSPSMAPDLAQLFGKFDLRKFMLAALRDFHAQGDTLSVEQATLLRAVSETLDPQAANVFARQPETGSPPQRISFDHETKPPLRPIRIAIYFRGEFFPNSRPHDLAYRFASGFETAGATCRLKNPDHDPHDIADCDIALIDDPHVFRKSDTDKRAFLERVRKRSARMVMLEMDPWARGRTARIAANRDLYDLVWAMMPSLLDVQGRIDGMKASAMMFPVGAPALFDAHADAAVSAGPRGIGFCGGIEEFNFYRYYWVVGAAAMAHRPTIDITNHHADGLSVETSLDRYVRRLGATYACLNFVRRANGRTSMVGRTADALRLGRLLVQERAAETSYYLTAGEHFVDFFDLGELGEICRRLSEGGGAYEPIRANGRIFFDQVYSDGAVLRHMATWL